MTMDNRSVEDINNDEAPATSSFQYVGKLIAEEWVYLPLEKRTRGNYIKPDVPYYHVAVQPLSYKITDGGQEGDNLEHTYATMKNAQGELTPKGSARDELVKAFEKLGFRRATSKDLQSQPAVGGIFKFKRYNRVFTDRTTKEQRNGELMNVPVDKLPNDWAPPPGQEVPVYQRAPRNSSSGSAGSVVSGSVAKPTGVALSDVANALISNNVAFTETAVRSFVLDRSDLAQGEALDKALTSELLATLTEQGLVSNSNGVISAA